MTVVDLEKERLNRDLGDSMNPIDVLRDLAFKIEDGRLDVKGVLILALIDGEEQYMESAWASLSATQRLALAEIAKRDAIDWLTQ